MTRRRFLIPSILAAGFGSQDPALAAFTRATATATDDPNAGRLLRLFTQDHYVTLASHSSHSSHSSHASHSSGYGGGGHYSHTSHRSGAGGYDGGGYASPLYSSPSPTPAEAPAPAPSPTPAAPPPAAEPLFGPSIRAAPPPPDGLPALSGRTKRFAAIVRRVQLALLAQGFYSGAIDGVVGPALRGALRKFQKDRGIEPTGTITPSTLDALMVSSE